MEIRPLTQEEQKYTYTQSMQLQGQTGSIGYLRGDFDSSGYGFFSSWNDHRIQWKTEEFKAEFDTVINALRSEEYGLLMNRPAMAAYRKQYPDSVFCGNDSKEFGFRVDSGKHAYFIRCNCAQGEYNFYCYCYVAQWLDRHMKNAERGIRFIDPGYNERFRIPDGGIIEVTTAWGEKLERICRYIDEYHVEIGNDLYHICEFAEKMERNGASYGPKQEEPQPAREPEEKEHGQEGERKKEAILELATLFGTRELVQLTVGIYQNNKGLYVGLTTKEEGYEEPYGDVTVNLEGVVPDCCAFVDTNNMPELKEFLAKNGIAEFTGIMEQSGFCTYPLYSFHTGRLRELCPDGMAAYEQENRQDHKPQEKERSR